MEFDRFGIAMLRGTARNGWEWYNRWGRGIRRTLTWGHDRRDSQFQVLGMTRCEIFGHVGAHAGEIKVTGMAPCLFLRGCSAGDIEATFYTRSGSAATRLIFGGMEALCKPSGRPGRWIGFKFITRGVATGEGAMAEIHVDRAEGLEGGKWRLVRTLKGKAVGALTDGVPDYSLYLRTVGGTEQHYKFFSVREIGSGPAVRIAKDSRDGEAGAFHEWTACSDREGSGAFGW